MTTTLEDYCEHTMIHDYRLQRRVEFHETDAAGIVHFSNFFRYMESCEHAMFRSLGLSVDMTIDGVRYLLPRGHTDCRYLAPLRFEDEFEVQLLVREIHRKAIVNQYLFRKLDDPENRPLAIGSMTIVFATHRPDGSMAAVLIPQTILDLIQEAPSELLEFPLYRTPNP